MVDAGLLDGVQTLIACHVGVQALEKGTIIPGYRNLLGSTKFDVLFEGRNAHAAISPHQGRNAMLAACAAVLQLHALPRHGDGETRVNVGMITGGESRNAVPARVRICAELRGDTASILSDLEERAYAIVRGCADAQGVSAAIEPMGSSCPASSDPALVALIQRAAGRAAGVTRVMGVTDFKASDDAAVMMDAVQRQGGKAVYFGIGTRLADVHHNPRFDFDDSVLPMGVEILVNAVKDIATAA
jgi:aminobenzoyl-glutamate utilization protein A